MTKLDDNTPRGERGGVFMFIGTIGAMFNRGQTEQAHGLARLLAEAARSPKPVLEAREMAKAMRAFADVFETNPRLAARLISRTLQGRDATMRARFDYPPAPQPQRVAAAPKPRGP